MWLDKLNDRLEDYLVKHSSAQYSKRYSRRNPAKQNFIPLKPTEDDQVRAAISQMSFVDQMTLLGQLLLMIVFGSAVAMVGIAILFIIL